MVELRHVRYFVAVAEALSFRQASKRLRVSQPSLSVQIKQLEDELGVSLFRRSKRRVEITRAGEVFLSAAREILLRLQQASAAALHAESGELGTIRLGFVPTASFHILPRLLEKIRSTLPLVNVELREGSEDLQITGLRTGTLDVCVGHLSRTYDQIENILLIREPLVLALPKGHRAARKRVVGIGDLEGELFIMPSKDVLPGPHQMIATALLKHHISLDRYQLAEHFQTGVNLTRAGVGIMFLPASAKDFVPDAVVLRTPGFSIGPLDTFALWSRGNVDPLVHRVLSVLKEVGNELLGQAHRSAQGRAGVSTRLFR
ncbi:LysR substrate-binding domain-containing protein [Edaphobacter bradus]|uniref:LysR substrate-binding domain-containing protein n=1 Tax=Edaphobacter bradus TaxID=2259016 RepID=UPI0021DFB8AD|nr:LysR substrate-binding domain-containing protein [Edaphobacter bradus]